MLATKSTDLSQSPRTHMVEGHNRLQKLSFDTHSVEYMHMRTGMNELNFSDLACQSSHNCAVVDSPLFIDEYVCGVRPNEFNT